MRIAIYPGSFDPPTNGHLDVIERAIRLFDEIIIAVARNEAKKPTFTTEERITLLQKILQDNPKIRIVQMNGLLVEFARKQNANVIIRGLRAVSDFEFEFQMALMNRKLNPDVETIFLAPKEDFTYLSSRITKEVARLGGDISELVPFCVAEALKKKLHSEHFA